MFTISKTTSVNIEYSVYTACGSTRVKVEIDNEQIVLRARSVMTEVEVITALHRPSSITNAIYALVSDIEKEEATALTKDIYNNIN